MSWQRVAVAVVDGQRVLQLSTAEGAAPGVGEVAVRMTAAGVSYGDILARVGVLPGSGKPGYVPGFDVTGTVETLGPSVAGLQVGQAVTGLLPHGGYAEVVCVPAGLLLPLPQGVSPTAAAAAVLNYFVAYQMLHRVAKPRAGGRILAHGAGSGVGRALVELGRRAGLEVFGTARRAKDEAAALGATPIDYQTEDFVSVVRDAGGADAAFDAIGGTHFLGSYRTLRRGGTLVGFGVSSAWSGGKAKGPRAGLSLLGLLGSNIFPDGRHARFYTASRAIKHRETYRQDLGKVLELLAHREIPWGVRSRGVMLRTRTRGSVLRGRRGDAAGRSSAHSLLRFAPTAPASRGPSCGAGGAGCNARRSVAGRGQAAGDRRPAAGPGTPDGPSPPAFGDRVGVGRTDGRADHLGPGRAPHVVEHPGELAVPIADQEPPRSRLLAEAGQQIAGLLGDPETGRMVGDAGKVHAPAAEFDDEQHIHAPQEDRADREQVAGHDPGGLLAQERPPARCSAPGRRVKTVGAQYPPDRAGRHPQAKTEQLTVDPLVAPPRILAGKPHDQLLHLV